MSKDHSVKTILCFGDSNTYGFKPDGSGRYDFNQRYPGRLQQLLGHGYRIIEEGCPGRTTVFEDENRPGRQGLNYIIPCLASHTPIDWAVVMLGTNDCKKAFHNDAARIGAGFDEIIKAIRSADHETRILIVSPIHLGDNVAALDPAYDRESIVISRGLAQAYEKVAAQRGAAFLDAAAVAAASPIDAQHLDAEGHHRLAAAIAKTLTASTSSL